MNKVLKYILAMLMVFGAGVAYFSDVPVAEYLGLAVSFCSAGSLCGNLLLKSKKKDWKVIASMILVAISALGFGFCGVATESVTELITAVVSIIILVGGLILSKTQK